MDSDQKPHNNHRSELFICFTSRLSSSSSMKISSKSILSPGRTREPSQISLSSSLSRRLRNGSIKGGQASPMFPTAGKKKGCAFENPEPSSPKVTCIGQVRVKTKKQGKKMRSRSKRRGEVSFRRVDQSVAGATNSDTVVGQISRSYSQTHFNQEQRNQKWVHLPMTICEALRAFGADFNCFLPCRPSCVSSGEKVEKAPAGSESSNTSSSCGAVFRWLVAVQEGEGKGREIELVVGEEEKSPESRRSQSQSQRRHVFEDIDIEEEKIKNIVEAEAEEEEARVSICVPPKNALLLMRCRSDPVKMAALANRFWESPLHKEPEEQEEEEEYQEAEESQEEKQNTVQEREHSRNEENEEENRVLVMEEDLTVEEQKLNDLFTEAEEQENPEPETEVDAAIEECNVEDQETEVVTEEHEIEDSAAPSSADSSPLVPEEHEIEDFASNSEEEEEENRASVPASPMASAHSQSQQPEAESDSESNSQQPEAESDSESNSQQEDEDESQTEKSVAEAQVLEEIAFSVSAEKEDSPEEEEKPEPDDPNPPIPTREYEPGRKSKEREPGQNQKRLPDCLLLMMCEPKLSMEVSKETWVCSTDFIRWLPERPPVKGAEVAKTDVPDEPKKRVSIDSNPAQQHQIKHPRQLLQPPRSSCSFPAQPPASMIEPKLDKAKAYEPFVLTRCKSEPMRSASKLAPEACCWNNRKLEPHRPGIGATGVGC